MCVQQAQVCWLKHLLTKVLVGYIYNLIHLWQSNQLVVQQKSNFMQKIHMVYDLIVFLREKCSSTWWLWSYMVLRVTLLIWLVIF